MLGSLIVQDPRLDVYKTSDNHATVVQGAERITHVIHQALSVSNSQANWNIQPPKGVIIDRDILIRFWIQYTLTVSNIDNNAADPMFQNLFSSLKMKSFPGYQNDSGVMWSFSNGGLSFRQAPIGAVTESTSMIVNGENINDNISQKLHPILTYGNEQLDEYKNWSRTQMEPDRAQDYSFQVDAASPFLNYYNVSRGVPARNRPFDEYFQSVGASTTTYTFRIHFTEPLWLSPFGLDYGKVQGGVCNLDSIQIIQRYKPLLNTLCFGGSNLMATKLLQAVQGVSGQSFTATLTKQPEILMNYMTPNPSFAFPFSQTFPMVKSMEYLSPTVKIMPGATSTTTLDTIRLSTIPEAVFIYAKPTISDTQDRTDGLGLVVPDVFCSISRVQVTFENQSGIMSTYSSEQLYETCLRNGSNLSWDEWRYYKGSVLKLNFSKDIGLDPGSFVGQPGNYSFQATIDIFNPAPTLTDTSALRNLNQNASQYFQVWMVFVMPGSITVAPGTAKATLGLVPVAAASRGSFNQLEDPKFFGGGVNNSSRWSQSKKNISAIYGGGDDPFGKRRRI